MTDSSNQDKASQAFNDKPKQSRMRHASLARSNFTPFGWVSATLGVLYACTLVATARPIGYSRDESFYFDAARQYANWVKLLFEHHAWALTRNAIDAHFTANHEHPPLMKLLFGLSNKYLYEQLHWVSSPGLSFRLPAMVLAAVGISVLAVWGARSISRTAGLVAALSVALMPRFFHHAHLACFDVPVACMCCVTAFAWSRALQTRKLGWSLGLGLVYGLTLATKHNAWLLPPAFLLHWLITQGRPFWRSSWSNRAKLIMPLGALITLGPLVLYALWPWLWFETKERLLFWLQFHMKHEYYNMEFLGVTYWKPPMPRSYAWVMTLATVPLTTLLLSSLGWVSSVRSVIAVWASKSKAQTSVPLANQQLLSDVLLWSICIIAFYLPWLSSDTPIFGGTKHWMTAYPFIGLLAAVGFAVVVGKPLRQIAERFVAVRHHDALRVACACLVLLPGALIATGMGPWGLSAYTPIVGGASGAATLGLNRTFWGYTTLSLAEQLALRKPARLYLHDMTLGAWDMHQRDGTVPRDIVGTYWLTESDLAVYQHEPHMERVEYQIWSAYGSSTPAGIGTYDGVPVVWFFDRRNSGQH